MSEREARILRQIDRLAPDELLALHREVCRRAAVIYGERYGAVQKAHYETAMAARAWLEARIAYNPRKFCGRPRFIRPSK